MNKKITIATPLYPPDIGGPAKYAKNLQETFERMGYPTKVVAYGKVERILPPLLRHAYYSVRLFARAFGSGCIIALDTWSVGVPAACAAALARRKLLVRVSGDFVWEQYIERTGELVKFSDFYTKERPLSMKERAVKWGTGFLVRRADLLLFNSSWQRDIWQKAYAVTPSRTHIIGNEQPAVVPAPAQNKVFVAAGRNIKLKNLDKLREVFVRVQARYPEVALDTALVPPQEHSRRLAAAYAVIIPSISEMNPNLIAEGVSLGKPFICTSDTGLSELVRPAGILVDTSDSEALLRAVERLLDPEEYARLCDATHGIPARGWEEVAKDMLSAVNEL